MVTSQSNDPPAPPGVSAAGRAATAGGGAPPLAPPGCDVVTVPARQGLEAVDILRRGAGDAVGPVLHDGGGDTLGFLVPPGTAAAWDVPGSTCTETDGRGLRPSPEPPVEGSDWLLPPGDADPATDPAVLRAALDEAQRLIEAADSCR
ncbi:hypothetical protein [Streptomyces griseomycini]|uniref:Uncharacterized protein n=1 Tax=Streptomyces griseomycini TaxID=66895 RepID=A0A7W7V8B2_9ACTN|nr:hypothetical protein [Streptomyces griseomycini]MBB4901017.1 hypothetical protein [Streptomyces griseomycini]GGP87966.1 hypothetical protein GCM10010266_08750 [Streptomyces griseomycini]GGR16293.1 hypothetical protein GCM10015536_22330 [Streptomyces griseomycini]